jgi:hypothetical protein
VTVVARDSLGTTQTGFSGNVTLAVVSGGTLSGTTTKAATSGVVAFGPTEGANVGVAGTFNLSASAPGFVGALSSGFVVSAPPTFAAISDQTSLAGTTSTSITGVTVGSGGGSLVFSATSSNSARIDPSSLVFTGSGSTRTLSWTPLAAGPVSIAVTVSDGSLSTTRTFSVELYELAFTLQPVGVSPAEVILVTLTARDYLGSTVTGFTGNVSIALEASGTLLGTTTKAATAGVAAFGATEAANVTSSGTFRIRASA